MQPLSLLEMWREKVGEEDSDVADVDLVEPMLGVYFNVDGRCFRAEEGVVDAVDELVVPGGVCVSVRVDTCGEFLCRVDPGDSVGPHIFGEWGKVLSGDDVELEELERDAGLLLNCR